MDLPDQQMGSHRVWSETVIFVDSFSSRERSRNDGLELANPAKFGMVINRADRFTDVVQYPLCV